MDPEVFYALSYGLYIVSAHAGNKKNGYVANTVFQVTATPSQLAVSCNKDNLTAQLISESGFFGVSVLQQDASKEIIGRFGYKSGKDTDKFADTQFVEVDNGIPVVTESCMAWFACRLVKTVDVGTHLLFVGEVINGAWIEKDRIPLTYKYYREERHGRAPKNAPTYSAPTKKPVQQAEPVATKSKTGKWICSVCDHIYDPAEGDPEAGIPAGTPFEALPDDWKCPVCGAEKADFEPYNE